MTSVMNASNPTLKHWSPGPTRLSTSPDSQAATVPRPRLTTRPETLSTCTGGSNQPGATELILEAKLAKAARPEG
jgi:hypothetical protein